MVKFEEMSVLIVDDRENMCKSIRGMLKVLRCGNKYRFAHNGWEGLKVLKEAPIDLIISDWNMPIMTGVEMLEKIRQDPALRDIPVVMVTAEANREIVAEAAESDIDAYILKPLTVKALGNRIVAVIQKANNPPPMLQHLKRARDLKESGDIEAAIEETKLAQNADPQSSKPIRELGFLYYQKNDLNTAEKCFLKASKMNKLDVFAYHCLGEIYLKREDIDRAALCFEKAMQVSPRHISRAVYFGKVLMQKGLLKRAEGVFNNVIALSGNSKEILEDLIAFNMAQGAYSYAIELLGELLKVDPRRFDMLCLMGEAHEKIQEPLNALKFYMTADEIEKESVSLKLRIAKIMIALGQTYRADKVLMDLQKIDPQNAEVKQLLTMNV
jgi:CheY-like chemotaxis protein